jgi:hypothetical protein
MTLTPTAVPEPNNHGGITVWTEWTGVDRPRTYGISVTKRNAPRLVRAINAGVVFTDARVATDVDGKTYVAATSQVHTRYINVDLTRLGY